MFAYVFPLKGWTQDFIFLQINLRNLYFEVSIKIHLLKEVHQIRGDTKNLTSIKTLCSNCGI